MNNELRLRFSLLSAAEKADLRRRLSDSPKSLLLLDWLQKKGSKPLNTVEIVDVLYNSSEAPFATRRNRFFKLRAELLRLMSNETEGKSNGLLPLEEKLLHCRQLTIDKQFGNADTHLRSLIAECRSRNIFELLPEALLLQMQCAQSINLVHETPALLSQLTEARQLLDVLRQLQGLNRLSYYHSINNNVGGINECIEQMRRIMLRHPHWPRFRLLYHFTAFNNRVAHPSINSRNVMHHHKQVKLLAREFPDMPCMNYEKNGAALLQQYLLNGEATWLFLRGKISESYARFKQCWELQERLQGTRSILTDSYFNNRISVETAAGYFSEALKTASAYMEFLNSQHNQERKLMGVAVLTNIYTYAWPKHKAPDPDFLLRGLNNYARLLQKNENPQLATLQATQAIFAFQCAQWKLAQKLAVLPHVKQLFTTSGIGAYNKLLLMHPGTPRAEIKKLKQEIETALFNPHQPIVTFSNERALRMIAFLQQQ
ncbi:MAG: hypothetical protein IM638_17930 [Bacteroidetes bacterium]|nr:hypothetical protein [Bacteroidota bacterium]